MIQRHLLDGVAASASRIQSILPYINKDIGRLRVLDVGCGSGMGCAAFSHLGAREIIGFDLGRDILGLNLARLRTYDHRATVSFVQASGYRIPLPRDSIDLCWCSFVLEHVTQPNRLVKEMYRVLVPSGIAYISTNNRLWPIEPHSGTLWTTWLPIPLAEKYVRWRRRWPQWESWDVYSPTYWQMHRWAVDAGFQVVASTNQLVGEKFQKRLRQLPWLGIFEAFFPNLYLLLKK